MAADGKLLLRVLLLQSLVLGACCSCSKYSPHKQFCDHKYVMKVSVNDGKPIGDRSGYVREMIKIFNGDSEYVDFAKASSKKLKFKRGRYSFLILPRYCATDYLKPGDIYITFGSTYGYDMYTDLCTESVKWQFFPNAYGINVYNKSESPSDFPRKKKNDDSCRWLHSILK